MLRVMVSGIPATVLIFSIVSLEPFLRNKIPNPILFFGAASYSLYLFHPIIAPAVPVLLNKYHIPVLSLSVSLSILAALSAGAFIYWYIEVGITRFVKQLTKNL